MKKNIIMTMSAIVLSIAFFNASKSKSVKDYSINQIGCAAIYSGCTSESNTIKDCGGWMCGFGGSCIVKAGYIACSSAIASNPVGWAIGGVVLCL